jgi:hypothetical protein
MRIRKMLIGLLVAVAVLFFLSAAPVIAGPWDGVFCEGDFTYDGDVDADDVTEFLIHFGREPGFRPCPPDGPAPVAKTGQTTSYYEGDDGGRQKGVEWPNPRFMDNGDGTVTDNLTGLIWLKNANCFGLRNWVQALTDCNVLAHGQCGLTDGSSGAQWRLPNLFELESLRDMRYWEPALSNSAGTGQWTHGDPFINLMTSGFYWSSSTSAYYTDGAWFVSMYDGYVVSFHKSNYRYVWPVRGGR